MNSSVEFIRAQRQLLEASFAKTTLEALRASHPAAVRWQLCRTMLQQGGVIRWPTQRQELPILASMMLDAAAFIRVSDGDLQAFSLGDLSGYGDAAVQRKIQSRLNDPNQFQDLMAELSLAAWHQFEGHAVTPYETDGWPDLKVVFAADDLPILLECKRLHVTSSTRLAKQITKANRQIRHAQIAAYGIVALDVTTALSGGLRELSDDIPEEIALLVEPVRAALSGPKNRSVDRVLLIWDDVGMLGDPPKPTAIFLRRRFLVVDHEPVAGVRSVPQTARTFQGNTVMLALSWDQSTTGIETIRSSDLMKECSHWFSFTNDELLESFVHNDKCERIPLKEDAYFILFARRSTAKRSFILALGSRSDTVLNLQFALRTPPHLYDELDLFSASEMLERLVAEYGLEVVVGGISSRFVARHRFEIAPGYNSPLSQVRNEQDHSVLHSMILRIDRLEDVCLVDCAMVFALDRTKLAADLAAQP